MQKSCQPFQKKRPKMSYQRSSLGGTSQGLEPVPYILAQIAIICSLRPQLTAISFQKQCWNQTRANQGNLKMCDTPTNTHILQICTLNKQSRLVASLSPAEHSRCNVLISCHLPLIAQEKQDRLIRKSLLKEVFTLEQYNLAFTILV